MTLIEKLNRAVDTTSSLVCVGLDVDKEKLPPFLVEQFKVSDLGLITEFNRRIIDATAAFASTYKPNLAFYENLGTAGWEALAKTVAYIHDNHPNHLVILDGKRNDIGNTAAQYAAALKRLGADAVTVNGYLGPRTLDPFLEAGLGIFALCVTTNPDAPTFQRLEVKYGEDAHGKPLLRPLYQQVAITLAGQHKQNGDYAKLWPGNLGLVTGATHPKELGEVRDLVGDNVTLLIPGIGKQEGSLMETVRNNKNGPAVINISRSCIYASSDESFAKAAGQAAKKLRDEINQIHAQM